MVKGRGVVLELFESRIKNTKEKEIVALESVYICRLTRAVLSVLGFSDSKVHINTKVLKHLYDKKPAEEFDFVIRNLHTIIKYPDHIYKNKISKRGDFCLVKEVKNFKYLCSVEFCEDGDEMKICVVTVFRVRDEAYLKKYELLWSWKVGLPSS
jgi:hypothetical protein